MVANHQDQIGKYFLEQAKLNVSSIGDVEEEAPPTELNTINSSGGFLVVSPDKLSVQYTSVNLHGHDVGVIQSNRPAPIKRLTYFFEMTVKNGGAKGQIAIGFTNESFKMCRQPGWEANSYGYHGDDGFLYRGHGKGEPFGPTFTTGDTVGCGINYASQEVFFTKNRDIVGAAYKDVKGPLFPTVAVHSQNEEVTVNFGKEPFVFDIKAYAAQEGSKQQTMIEKISLPQDVSYGIVRSYLLHCGYEDTLNVFDMANDSCVPPITISQENGLTEQHNVYALNHRKTLRQLIRSGKIDAAFGKIHEWFPQILQNDKSLPCFLLHCQKFIELIRVRELEDAIKYGREELSKFFWLEDYKALAQVYAALLAYEEPLNSTVPHLLGESHRELVADTVNAMILSTNPNRKDSSLGCLHSPLEKLLRQLTACQLEMRAWNGNQGEAIHANLTHPRLEPQVQEGLAPHRPSDEVGPSTSRAPPHSMGEAGPSASYEFQEPPPHQPDAYNARFDAIQVSIDRYHHVIDQRLDAYNARLAELQARYGGPFAELRSSVIHVKQMMEDIMRWQFPERYPSPPPPPHRPSDEVGPSTSLAPPHSMGEAGPSVSYEFQEPEPFSPPHQPDAYYAHFDAIQASIDRSHHVIDQRLDACDARLAELQALYDGQLAELRSPVSRIEQMMEDLMRLQFPERYPSPPPPHHYDVYNARFDANQASIDQRLDAYDGRHAETRHHFDQALDSLQGRYDCQFAELRSSVSHVELMMEDFIRWKFPERCFPPPP